MLYGVEQSLKYKNRSCKLTKIEAVGKRSFIRKGDYLVKPLEPARNSIYVA